MRRDKVMRRYADALMGLCEQGELARVRVADVVAASGMSKPTFYSHFPNLAALVGFTASRSFLDEGAAPLFTEASVAGTYRYALEHPAFFAQLPAQQGPASFRETSQRWLRRKAYATFAPEGLPQAVRLRRMVQCDVFVAGSEEVMSTWLADRMSLPYEQVAGAVIAMMPEFMRLPGARTETALAPDDYPR